MKVVWFSEVKWNYLTHRHHQLIGRFPPDWNVLFIENFVLGRDNHYWPRKDGRVTFVTIPTFKPTNRPLIDRWQGITGFRRMVSGLITVWVSLVMRLTGFFRADVLVTSNIFFADVVRRLAGPKIYDCNDYPMGFPRALPFTGDYFARTIRSVDLVVTVTEKLKEDVIGFGPKAVTVIGNGVDSSLFKSAAGPVPAEVGKLEGPVVLYVGVLSDWFDFNLLTMAARQYPQAHFVNLGPVISPSVEQYINDAIQFPNIHFPGMKPHQDLPAYVHAAKVCWIPFKKNNLIERFSPNKLYEYAAAGRPVVTMDYTQEIRELAGLIHVAKSPEDMIRLLGLALQEQTDENRLHLFAADHDWNHKASRMIRCIEEVTGEAHADV